MAEMYMFTIITIIEANAEPQDNARSFLLKEAIGTLGIMASDPDHRLALTSSDILLIVLKIGRQHLTH